MIDIPVIVILSVIALLIGIIAGIIGTRKID